MSEKKARFYLVVFICMTVAFVLHTVLLILGFFTSVPLNEILFRVFMIIVTGTGAVFSWLNYKKDNRIITKQ